MKPTVSRLEGEYGKRMDFLPYDAAGLDDDTKLKYKYVAFPQIVLIDAKGEIAFSRLGFQTYDSLKADIENVLRR